MVYEELTYEIRGACFEVFNALGSGFKETVYHNALSKEFKLRKLNFEGKKRLKIYFKDEEVGIYEPDFIVDDKIIIEVKAVPIMPKYFENQLYYYLKCTEYKLGLLINFGANKLDIRRRIYEKIRGK
ncbi:MAG: GxxExxY protein [bacterium]